MSRRRSRNPLESPLLDEDQEILGVDDAIPIEIAQKVGNGCCCRCLSETRMHEQSPAEEKACESGDEVHRNAPLLDPHRSRKRGKRIQVRLHNLTMRKSIHHGSETSTAKCERGVGDLSPFLREGG